MPEGLICPKCRIERIATSACPVCGTSLLPSGIVGSLAQDEGPKSVGRYRLEEQLGSGGMGVVWKAHDPELNRTVALKLLHADLPDEIRRLQREAQISARLRHPGIAAVHDVGVADGQAYIAMELIDGQSADRLNLPVRRAVEVLRDAADAVHYAHSQGVVHRDLKPGNLMVERAGRVYVMDFGLAKQSETTSSMSMSGAIMGTPSYMSPEQARGQSKHADARSDVYGLGATLYFLLTGHAPFEGESMYDVTALVVQSEPKAPRRWNPRIPADLDTIILKCLEKEPHRRYASAKELSEDLTRFLENEAITARPQSSLYKLGKALAKRKAFVAAVCMTLLALGAVGAFGWKNRERRQRGEAVLAEANRLYDANEYGPAAAKYEEARGLGLAVPEDRVALCARELRDSAMRSAVDEKLQKAILLMQECDQIQRTPHADVSQVPAKAVAALRLAEDAVQTAPEYPNARLMRGRILTYLGDLDRAIADFSEALRLDPAFSLARYERGRALLNRLRQESQLAILDTRARNHEQIESWRRQAEDDFSRAGADLSELARDDRASLRILLEFLKLPLEDSPESREMCLHVARAARETAREVPHLADAWIVLSTVLRMRGEFDAAEQAVKEGIESSGEPVALLYVRADLRGLRGDWRGQKEDFQRVVNRMPRNVFALHALAVAHSRLKEWTEAKEVAERALALEPRFLSSANIRALAVGRLGDWREARRQLEAILELDPVFIPALCNRALALGQLGDRDGAIREYDRIEKLYPGEPAVFNNRGYLRSELGDWKGAMEDFNRSIHLRSNFADPYLNRAMAHKHFKNWKGVEADLTRAIELGARSPFVHSERGNARAERGAGAGAIEDLTAAIDGGFSAPAMIYDRGFAYGKMSRWLEAIADFDRAEELGFRTGRLYQHRGFARGMSGDWKGAVQDMDRAVELGLQDATLFNNRANARYITGDLPGAEDDCTRALELDPNHAMARFNRGAARRALAERATGAPRRRLLEGAIEDFEKYLSLEPSSPYADTVRKFLEQCRQALRE